MMTNTPHRLPEFRVTYSPNNIDSDVKETKATHFYIVKTLKVVNVFVETFLPWHRMRETVSYPGVTEMLRLVFSDVIYPDISPGGFSESCQASLDLFSNKLHDASHPPSV